MNVLLISMPWAYYEFPSIQIACLKSFLQKNGRVNVDADHFFLRVGDWLGEENYNITYKPFIEDGESLYGAMLFDEIAFKLRTGNLLVDKFKLDDSNIAKNEFLISFDLFHKQQFEEILSKKSYDLIGLTLNFGQTLSSIYASRIIKKIQPDAKIIFGGAEVSDELGVSLLQNFSDDIDFICNGEGELPLLNLINNNLNADNIDGIVTINKLRTNFSQIKNINSLPIPDYSDYFGSRTNRTSKITIPYESSRGCYYQCNFCALNLQWSGYRQKNPEKVLDDINKLYEQYGFKDFFYVDNITPTMLSKRSELFMDNKTKYDFFYEARTTLTKKQFVYLKQIGVNTVQLGIEAFSNSILKKYNKKSTVMHNIAALKYCAELGIKVVGNLITEHPETTSEEIEETINVIKLCFAYPPVDSISPYALEVGSPDYEQLKKKNNSFINYRSYKRAYPDYLLNELNLPRKEVSISAGLIANWKSVEEITDEWQELYSDNPSSLLSFNLKNDKVVINDRRYHESYSIELNKSESKLFTHLETPKEISQLSNNLNMDKIWIADTINKLIDMKLLFVERNKCIALPTFENDFHIR